MVESEIDVGEVEWTTRTPATFVLKNQCDHPVRILSIDASCACAVPDRERLTGSEVAPGGTLPLPVVFEAKTDAGFKEYTLKINTTSGIAVGALKGRVVADWSIDRVTVDIGTAARGPDAQSRIRIMLARPRVPHVSGVSSRACWLQPTELVPLSDTEYSLGLQVDSVQLEPGLNWTFLDIETSSPYVPKRSVLVIVRAAV